MNSTLGYHIELTYFSHAAEFLITLRMWDIHVAATQSYHSVCTLMFSCAVFSVGSITSLQPGSVLREGTPVLPGVWEAGWLEYWRPGKG